jgi:hypothetical protein
MDKTHNKQHKFRTQTVARSHHKNKRRVFLSKAICLSASEGLSASGGLFHWANNRAVFTIFMMSLGANFIKAEKKSKNADHYCH